MLDDEERQEQLETSEKEKHWFDMPDDISKDLGKLVKQWQADHERQKLEAQLEVNRQLKQALEDKGFQFIPVNDKGKVKVIYPDGRELIDYDVIVLDKLRADKI